ncbi:hypothetical protein [Dendronalium sp. ChiSLP03b]|uniref:hypothetical protein n=1 Tax=Dendronalium sp. ChiSLP03b TaxID=3075381 RepID=UPI002AD77D06|nr:hypothetical protein [Dendronalium sp. ChiSLP03b]
MNQVDAHVVQPLVMGQLFGFIGVLLAVPAAAVIIALINEFTPEEPALEQLGIQSITNVKSND